MPSGTSNHGEENGGWEALAPPLPDARERVEFLATGLMDEDFLSFRVPRKGKYGLRYPFNSKRIFTTH